MAILKFLLVFWMSSCAQGVRPIFVSYMASMDDFSGAKLAVQLALEHINSNPKVLPDYTINVTEHVQTQCDSATSLKDFVISTRQENQTTIASLCCGCAEATSIVAQVSSLWNVVQISYTFSPDSTSDTNPPKRLFKLFPFSDSFPFAVLSVLRLFDWKRVVLITQNKSPFLQIYDQLSQLISNESIYLQNVVFSSAKNALTKVISEGFKIIVLNCYSEVAKMVICEASKRGMTHMEYVWILHGWYPENWWKASAEGDCSSSQMVDVLNLSIIIEHQLDLARIHNATVSGYTPQTLLALYRKRLDETSYSFSPVFAVAYDAVWTLALALNKTITQLGSNSGAKYNRTVSDLLETFSYIFETPLSSQLLHNLKETSFDGASGEISFTSDGNRKNFTIGIAQLVASSNVTEVQIGSLSTLEKSRLYFYEIPQDRNIITFPPGVSEVFYSLAAIGIIFTFVCAVFNFLCRDKRVVQLSSPNLNYFILLGALLGYCSVIVLFVRVKTPELSEFQCICQDWSTILGYVLAFSTVLAKIWRINYICNNPSPKKEPPKDWHLATTVVSTTGLSAIILLLKTFLPMMSYNSLLILETSSENVVFCYTCTDTQTPKFYGTLMLYGFIAVLQVAGLALVYQSKYVASVPSLNDAKSVTALVYISTVCFGIIAFVAFQLRGNLTASNCIMGLTFLVLIFSFLGLVFCPKMWALYKDPSGKMVFNVQIGSGASTNSADTMMKRNSQPAECNLNYITALETRIHQLELNLEQVSKNEGTKTTEYSK